VTRPEEQMEQKNGFLDIVKITYFTQENAKFYTTKNGFVCLNAFMPPIKKDDLEENTSVSAEPVWQDLGRVFFHRAFPFDMTEEFISVLDKDGKEYGVIKNLSDFSGEMRDVIENELRRKYYTPEIIKVFSLKERFGYSYWEVETDRGRMSFAIHDTFRNIARISETRIVITDVDGNRYNIQDVTALDRQSYRKIELYL
jgi:hypothetical protein